MGVLLPVLRLARLLFSLGGKRRVAVWLAVVVAVGYVVLAAGRSYGATESHSGSAGDLPAVRDGHALSHGLTVGGAVFVLVSIALGAFGLVLWLLRLWDTGEPCGGPDRRRDDDSACDCPRCTRVPGSNSDRLGLRPLSTPSNRLVGAPWYRRGGAW